MVQFSLHIRSTLLIPPSSLQISAHSLHISSQAPALSPHATTLHRSSNEKRVRKLCGGKTKPVDYELNSKHQTPEQQPSSIPTVRSSLPALRATFSLIIPQTGKCKCRSNIYQGKKSHLFSNASQKFSGIRNLI